MSAYNIKWLGVYIIYSVIILWIYIEGVLYEKDLFYTLILIPVIAYLLMPLILRKFGHMKIIGMADKIIDYWYQTIKECVVGKSKKEESLNNNSMLLMQEPKDKEVLIKNGKLKNVLIILLQVTGLLLLFMLAGAVPYIGVPAIIVFFWINWDKIFKKKK